MAPTTKYQINAQNRFCCPNCDKTFKSSPSCSNHWRKEHKPPTVVITIPNTPRRRASTPQAEMTAPTQSVSRQEFDELNAKCDTIINMLKNMTTPTITTETITSKPVVQTCEISTQTDDVIVIPAQLPFEFQERDIEKMAKNLTNQDIESALKQSMYQINETEERVEKNKARLQEPLNDGNVIKQCVQDYYLRLGELRRYENEYNNLVKCKELKEKVEEHVEVVEQPIEIVEQHVEKVEEQVYDITQEQLCEQVDEPLVEEQVDEAQEVVVEKPIEERIAEAEAIMHNHPYCKVKKGIRFYECPNPECKNNSFFAPEQLYKHLRDHDTCKRTTDTFFDVVKNYFDLRKEKNGKVSVPVAVQPKEDATTLDDYEKAKKGLFEHPYCKIIKGAEKFACPTCQKVYKNENTMYTHLNTYPKCSKHEHVVSFVDALTRYKYASEQHKQQTPKPQQNKTPKKTPKQEVEDNDEVEDEVEDEAVVVVEGVEFQERPDHKEFLLECCRTMDKGGFVDAYHYLNDPSQLHFVKQEKAQGTVEVYDVASDKYIEKPYMVKSYHMYKDRKTTKTNLSCIRDELEPIYVTLCNAWKDYCKSCPPDEDMFDAKQEWLNVAPYVIHADNIDKFCKD